MILKVSGKSFKTLVVKLAMALDDVKSKENTHTLQSKTETNKKQI